ncbi:hypothetical protein GCM10028785_09820 [Hydrogenophaga soli]
MSYSVSSIAGSERLNHWQVLGQTLNKAVRIGTQSGQRKAPEGQPKLYAWHAPEVDCISKDKRHYLVALC